MRTVITHIRRRWTADEDAARRYGWTIERGRFGSVTVRDPRFDELDECSDCLGSGHCPITGEPESCLTCNGTGVCPRRIGRGAIRISPSTSGLAQVFELHARPRPTLAGVLRQSNRRHAVNDTQASQAAGTVDTYASTEDARAKPPTGNRRGRLGRRPDHVPQRHRSPVDPRRPEKRKVGGPIPSLPTPDDWP
jgi:hypothetical protein